MEKQPSYPEPEDFKTEGIDNFIIASGILFIMLVTAKELYTRAYIKLKKQENDSSI